jgi:hypothetical protein
MGCFQSHDILASSAGLRASQCCAGVATSRLSAFALRGSMMSFNEADMPIMNHYGVPVFYLKGKNTTRGHRAAGMVKQKDDGGVLDALMGIAKASRKDFETHRIVICGKDGTTKVAMMEKIQVAKHHSEWRIYTYTPTYLGQNVAKDDEHLCCCDVEELLRQEAQRLVNTTQRAAGASSGASRGRSEGGTRGLRRGSGSGAGNNKPSGENNVADSDNDSDADSDSSEFGGGGGGGRMSGFDGAGGGGLGGMAGGSSGNGNVSGTSTTASPRDVSLAGADTGSALLSVLKPDDIASARHGQRDPRKQDQDTGKYSCSCPHNVYLFASVEKIESTRHSLVQHTRELPHDELIENTGAYAADLLENPPEGFIYRVFRSSEDVYEVWRAHPKIHHGPENWDRQNEMWVTKERLRGGGTLGKGANADGSFAFDPHLEGGKKKKKGGGGKGGGGGGKGGGGGNAAQRQTRGGGGGGGARGGGGSKGRGGSHSGSDPGAASAWKTKPVRRDVNGRQFDVRRPPPQIVGIVRERSPHFNFELQSRTGKRPDAKYSSALTRLGDDYLLEMVPGADPLGMILFCVAVDESMDEDMKIARAKIRSNKRKMREELGLKVDEDKAEKKDDAEEE